MKTILKPIFEMITGEYTLLDNVMYNYIAMLVIGAIAFWVAWDVVDRLYANGIIVGSKLGSIIHWTMRIIVFIGVFYIFNLIIWITKFVYTYRFIILMILAAIVLAIITFMLYRNKNSNMDEAK